MSYRRFPEVPAIELLGLLDIVHRREFVAAQDRLGAGDLNLCPGVWPLSPHNRLGVGKWSQKRVAQNVRDDNKGEVMQVVKTTVLVTMSLCAVIAYAQHASRTGDTTADEAALRAADDSFERAYHSGDLDTVVALYAEDALLMPDGAPAVRGREAIREYYRSAIAADRKAGMSNPGVLSDRAVGVSGEMGWSSGESTVVGPGGAIAWRGKFLSISRKVDGRWLYVRDTWNSDTPPPAAH